MKIIGIDPDTKESGVAVLEDDNFTLLTTMRLHRLFKYIEEEKPDNVCISAGWLNKVVNFHNKDVAMEVRERISERVGANHEIGKQIASFCASINTPYTLVRPRGKKVNSAQFNRLVGAPMRTNQEERDAAMTALFYSKKRIDI